MVDVDQRFERLRTIDMDGPELEAVQVRDAVPLLETVDGEPGLTGGVGVGADEVDNVLQCSGRPAE